MQKKTYLMLGRTGDIMNILPAIQYEAQKNDYKPRLIVSQDYQDILDGVSYVEKIVYPGDFRNVLEALVFAKRNFPEDKIVNCSVYGKNYVYKKLCASFQRESWRFTECPLAWGTLPLVFDKRSAEREQRLADNYQFKYGQKTLITALSGTSSPLPYKDMLLKYLRANLNQKEWQIVDISDLRAERIYDLLALYERASSLIAIDSAPLHLAQAMPHLPPELPVISLISDLKDTWHQSSWRRNHIKRILYSEVPTRLVEILEAVEGGFTIDRATIHLVTTSASGNEETKRRNGIALSSWFKERLNSGTGKWYLHIYNSVGLPKVHSMIEYAFARALYDDDIILITNADINFVPGITGWILHEVERHGAVFFHRHDFQRIDEHFISEAQVAFGKWYPGSDTFAFTKKWWSAHRTIFPDMYFAREAWDMIFRNMIKRSGGAEIHNAIYHEKHPSFWEATENRNCPENLHNRAQAQQWLDTYGGDWNDWKIKKPYK